jgi:hypothetical protein
VDKIPDGRLVFLGTDANVYFFDGATLDNISDPKSPKSSIQPTLDAVNVSRLKYAVVKYYPTKKEVWVSVAEGSSTSNNAIYVYSLTSGCWESKFTGISANYMGTIIDSRATPSHPFVMLTGNYGGIVYEQDRGNTNAEDPTGVIDGYGTVSLLGQPTSTDFIFKSGLFPILSNGNTSIELNYGTNGYTEIQSTVLLPQFAGGDVLDSFILDTSFLSSARTLMIRPPMVSSGRVSSVQIQLRNRQAGQDFTVSPFYLSDEVIT